MCVNVKYGIWKVNEPDPSAVNTLVRSGYAPLAAMVLAAAAAAVALKKKED